ncbi:unnamed protein product [Effrenium voratum]|nr:unnamed protein product [Effrenium voratum]
MAMALAFTEEDLSLGFFKMKPWKRAPLRSRLAPSPRSVSRRPTAPFLLSDQSPRGVCGGAATVLAFVLRRRRTSLRAAQQQEYLEEFDALGKELTGKAVVVGWDPGPKQAAATSEGPAFTPEESMEELEGLCSTLGIEVKERVLQRWRPYSGRLPIGSGKAEELRQQVKYDPELGVVVFDQDMSYRMLMTLKGRIAPGGECVILDRTSLILRRSLRNGRVPRRPSCR